MPAAPKPIKLMEANIKMLAAPKPIKLMEANIKMPMEAASVQQGRSHELGAKGLDI